VNKDRVSGKVEQVVGKVKESIGDTVGNEKLAHPLINLYSSLTKNTGILELFDR
jgi:hypothetical protein